MKRILFGWIVLSLPVFAGFSSAQSTKSAKVTKPQTTVPVTKPVNRQTLEMVFVLDTTGSMSGLLEGAKQRIWGIVNDVMRQDSRPAVRVGLVAYRDRGDQYVTQVLPLTEDLDQVYSTLMDYRADGGGDTPEDVRRAMSEALTKTGWSVDNRNVAQIMFLVGDAPPHNDYKDEPDTAVTASQAINRGIIVNTIQCGSMSETTPVWELIAQRGQGRFFAIPQDGGVQAITTPYDTKLTELGNRLGQTYTPYGGGAGPAGERYRQGSATDQVAMESKVMSAGAPSANADRAINKAVNSAAYVGDLLQSIENGTVKLDAVKTEDLPDDLKKLTPAARQVEVEKRLAQRATIRAEILTLGKQRTDFIAAEQRKQTGTKQNGFDSAVADALKTQMAAKGIK